MLQRAGTNRKCQDGQARLHSPMGKQGGGNILEPDYIGVKGVGTAMCQWGIQNWDKLT